MSGGNGLHGQARDRGFLRFHRELRGGPAQAPEVPGAQGGRFRRGSESDGGAHWDEPSDYTGRAELVHANFAAEGRGKAAGIEQKNARGEGGGEGGFEKN